MSKSQESLQQLIARLKIDDSWRLIVVGDGSGSSHEHPCGWAAIGIEHDDYRRLEHWGCMNRGTVNVAELMAYVQALGYYAAHEAKRSEQAELTDRFRVYPVHIITDSEYVATAGAKPEQRKAHRALWGLLDAYSRFGFQLNWYWRPREDVELNVLADALSKSARLLAKRHNPLEELAANGHPGLHGYNPTLKRR